MSALEPARYLRRPSGFLCAERNWTSCETPSSVSTFTASSTTGWSLLLPAIIATFTLSVILSLPALSPSVFECFLSGLSSARPDDPLLRHDYVEGDVVPRDGDLLHPLRLEGEPHLGYLVRAGERTVEVTRPVPESVALLVPGDQRHEDEVGVPQGDGLHVPALGLEYPESPRG